MNGRHPFSKCGDKIDQRKRLRIRVQMKLKLRNLCHNLPLKVPLKINDFSFSFLVEGLD